MIIMIPLQQVVGVLRLQATNNDDNDVSIIDNHASNYEKNKKEEKHHMRNALNNHPY